jgi:hypothetical protein
MSNAGRRGIMTTKPANERHESDLAATVEKLIPEAEWIIASARDLLRRLG